MQLSRPSHTTSSSYSFNPVPIGRSALDRSWKPTNRGSRCPRTQPCSTQSLHQSPQGERRTNDQREANFVQERLGFRHGLHGAGFGQLQPKLFHDLPEGLSIFGPVDDLAIVLFDVEFRQYTSSCSWQAQFNAVCPPKVGSKASMGVPRSCSSSKPCGRRPPKSARCVRSEKRPGRS